MDWLTTLKQDPDAVASFVETLEALKKRAVRRMDEARSWEEVLAARGEKKLAEQLLTSVTMADEEERAYARFRRGGT